MPRMIGGTIVSSQEDGLAKLARHARIVLVAIAAIHVGSAMLLWLAGGPAQWAMIVPTMVGAAIYGVLALWATRAPLPAVLVGFAIYLAGVAYSISQGGSILDGILFKVIFLALFLNGIQTALTYNKAKERLGK